MPNDTFIADGDELLRRLLAAAGPGPHSRPFLVISSAGDPPDTIRVICRTTPGPHITARRSALTALMQRGVIVLQPSATLAKTFTIQGVARRHDDG